MGLKTAKAIENMTNEMPTIMGLAIITACLISWVTFLLNVISAFIQFSLEWSDVRFLTVSLLGIVCMEIWARNYLKTHA
mgnify:FL=1